MILQSPKGKLVECELISEDIVSMHGLDFQLPVLLKNGWEVVQA